MQKCWRAAGDAQKRKTLWPSWALCETPHFRAASVFQFTRPAWGATIWPEYERFIQQFQFTRPAWGATRRPRASASFESLFQFTRPAWGATRDHRNYAQTIWFQFTRPAWGATFAYTRGSAQAAFQFTRPAWGATITTHMNLSLPHVSIHAPRVGRDHQISRSLHGHRRVSIHAPRVGRDWEGQTGFRR